MKKKNVFYAQSGGVTAVINASACGVIETARKHKSKLGRVYAGRNGILGALTEDMIDTTAESARTIAASRSALAGLMTVASSSFCRRRTSCSWTRSTTWKTTAGRTRSPLPGHNAG